ncbi:MAG TPA: ATP-binding protein [Mycobacteriales bacterium]|nr:ATP-binding protein [Mycobacteriales bacterium]
MDCVTREVLRLSPTRLAPAKARHAVHEFATAVSPKTAWTAELLASELVTNAVVHGRGPVSVVMEYDGGALAVTVTDEEPASPVLADPGTGDLGGRGLRLVELLASDWGVNPDQPGKGVWFRLD